MTTAQARTAIHENIAADIRACSAAHIRITLDVALANWAYFFEQGRGAEARAWWAVVHTMITEGK